MVASIGRSSPLRFGRIRAGAFPSVIAFFTTLHSIWYSDSGPNGSASAEVFAASMPRPFSYF